MAKRLTEERIEKMAVEIRAFLLEHGIWQDTDIYFNGKRFTTRDPETKKQCRHGGKIQTSRNLR